MTEKISPFEYVRSITDTKQRLDVSEYSPFFCNRALSLHPDLIFDVVDMNQYYDLPHDMQYDYYLHKVRKFKRYGKKWPKPEKNDDIDLIMRLYKYSREKAKAALKILGKDDLEYLRSIEFKGGIEK